MFEKALSCDGYSLACLRGALGLIPGNLLRLWTI
jgi:hypothetical protein